MKRIFLLFFIILAHKLFAFEHEKTGDIIRALLPITAYGTTLYLEDKEGQVEFYKSFTSNVALTYALKYVINRERPNGEDYSFPSGHTSVCFQASTFIHKRYGFSYAIPAYLLASFVGYGRVKTDEHYIGDVLAGALVGSLSSLYFTTQYKGFKLQAYTKNAHYGLSIKKEF